MESNIPIFGAVMNMVTSSAAAVSSLNYYDKSYQNYYTTPPAESKKAAKEDGKSNSAKGVVKNVLLFLFLNTDNLLK